MNETFPSKFTRENTAVTGDLCIECCILTNFPLKVVFDENYLRCIWDVDFRWYVRYSRPDSWNAVNIALEDFLSGVSGDYVQVCQCNTCVFTVASNTIWYIMGSSLHDYEVRSCSLLHKKPGKVRPPPAFWGCERPLCKPPARSLSLYRCFWETHYTHSWLLQRQACGFFFHPHSF